MSQSCPLCDTSRCQLFGQAGSRTFLHCSQCQLVFVPSEQHLSPALEKARYDHHQNSPYDQGYKTFLNRLIKPMTDRISPGNRGLDFGSGPGPTLSVMMTEAGYPMTDYDIFYANNPAVMEKQYDFVTATEVVEHLRQPNKVLRKIWNCLKVGGWLGIMTQLIPQTHHFSNWHYKNDPTHICFYSHDTFRWLANKWGARETFVGNDVILLQKI